jgi:hypothetical protein
MMYCIGLGTVEQPRYISTCDQYGYTTTSVKLYQFTQSEVNTVITQLRSRFQYNIFVLDQHDNVIFDTNNPQPKAVQKKASANGLVIKIRV